MNVSDRQKVFIDDFNDRVSSGKIKFESVNCLCSGNDFDPIAEKDRYGLIQKTVKCNDCGLLLSNPRMTAESYGEFYKSDDYRNCYEAIDYKERYKEFYIPEFGKHIYDLVSKYKKGSVLEIGAGGGWNLLLFDKAVGYDYSPSLVRMGQEMGIDMRQGGIEDVQGKYDIIILNHFLEHLLDPIGDLKKIKKLLRDDGIIYIAVPDMANYNPDQLQNAHTYYFKKDTLERYVKQAGITMIHSEPAEGIHLAGIFR